MLLTDKYLVTAVAEFHEHRYTGHICIKIYSPKTLEVIWEVRSSNLASQPSVQLLSVDDSGTVLLTPFFLLNPNFCKIMRLWMTKIFRKNRAYFEA